MTQWGLDALFNPAKRHMDEEKRRLQSTREQLGDSSGGKRIDLESGKVTIRRSAGAARDEADELDGSDPETVGDETGHPNHPETAETAEHREHPKTAEKSPNGKPHAKQAPSPAAIRAAKRRGRLPR